MLLNHFTLSHMKYQTHNTLHRWNTDTNPPSDKVIRSAYHRPKPSYLKVFMNRCLWTGRSFLSPMVIVVVPWILQWWWCNCVGGSENMPWWCSMLWHHQCLVDSLSMDKLTIGAFWRKARSLNLRGQSRSISHTFFGFQASCRTIPVCSCVWRCGAGWLEKEAQGMGRVKKVMHCSSFFNWGSHSQYRLRCMWFLCMGSRALGVE